jgi:DNA-binding NarL/FixJ family response regulator
LDGFERLGGDGLTAWASSAGAGWANQVRRLAIVDPSRLRRGCLKWRITDVAAAAELTRLIAQGDSFSVILLGGSTCRQISMADIEALLAAAPRTPILVAADCEERGHALAMMQAGARGFLPTNLSLRVLVAALERVRAGDSYLPLALSESGAAGGTAALTSPWRELTRRQREVLSLISEGRSNRSIAAALATTESTVKAHVKGIIRRLNVANRTQAALLAARSGTAFAARRRAHKSVPAGAA